MIDGKLAAVGILSVYEGSRTIVSPVNVPVMTKTSAAPLRALSDATDVRAATCDILNLVLGPLDLNLLGLRVQLNQVVLNITGETGPGNLLGNLLCAVANLLNGGGLLQQIADLLNRILGVLGA